MSSTCFPSTYWNWCAFSLIARSLVLVAYHRHFWHRRRHHCLEPPGVSGARLSATVVLYLGLTSLIIMGVVGIIGGFSGGGIGSFLLGIASVTQPALFAP